ncbi:U3 snoRNP-associated protein Esf2 [Rhodotorula toruloides]|uniref:U3 snoRNP-associated protein Esf2 n=1 Tax=Rhodotorula toruloides TaxID=5286 RepID=A0A511KE20_RHOTO|nr:U3 snoRNP-associated protein Esf2 [Rhodotorula toruloides]
MSATTPKSASKKRHASSGAAGASPRASTSRNTLDGADVHGGEGQKGGDSRFAAFLVENEAEDRDGAGEVDLDEGERREEGSVALDDDDDKELSEQDLLTRTTLPEHLLPRSLKKGAKTPGLVYLSRIPPGMGPASVRDLMSRYGDVGRLYLEPANKEKGGKREWKDDVWTMKYLPRFRWDQLSEQFALERATQTSLLRFHLSSTRTQNEAYLTAVERARTNKKIEEKAVSRGKQAKKRGVEEGEGEEKRKRFRQRERVDLGEKERREGKDGEGVLQSVLGRLF